MNILLGITGSIAAYKSYDVARALVKAGHRVKIILTSGALEFLRPETFRYLGVEAVHTPSDDFDARLLRDRQTVLHIELAKWATKFAIAPLSANTLGRITLGLNNDLLVSTYLAFGNKPVLLFPAMNTQMWNSDAVKTHCSKLSELQHVALVQPSSGVLACGDVGEGKFPEVGAVKDLIETIDPTTSKDRHVLVTAGATASPLDPVRYLTNPSTGRMGIAVAQAFLSAGYRVTLLAGHQCLSDVEFLCGHPRFELVRTPTTEAMRTAALRIFPNSDLYISTGAIADIEFESSSEKLKKEKLGSSLSFRQAADILKEVLQLRRSSQRVVSFAAETDTSDEVFLEKMRRKPVDLMVGNRVSSGLLGGALEGFQKESGEYHFVHGMKVSAPAKLSKRELGEALVAWFEGRSS